MKQFFYIAAALGALGFIIIGFSNSSTLNKVQNLVKGEPHSISSTRLFIMA